MLRGLWDALTFRPAPGESLDRRALFRHLSSERYWEWRLGLKTSGHISPEELSRLLGRRHAHEYGPVPFRAFWTMMESVPPDHCRGDFVDFGSGKGRALLLARSYGFRRLIGVEPIDVLRRSAEENVRRAGAGNVELVAADAADFEVPAEASVYFFYNPFGKDRFEPVLRNLRKSHHSHPRPASILALNSEDFLSLARDCTWLVPRQTGMAVPDMRWDRFEVGEA